ncbi:hypothetical protein [Streptomyces sp. NPDC020141]|uniref:hypothetical protein n=1 Tax=Streptomyces sp. NPDC020141 TaxID=3365065 RepID=UPI0037930FB5
MARSRITDFTGAEIRENSIIAFPTRQGNTVRNSEAVVKEILRETHRGRIIPMLRVRPTGRESGHDRRLTLTARVVSTEHVVVIGDAKEESA